MTFGDPRLPDRFWSKVIPEPMSGCWLWTGRVTRLDYGQFDVGSRRSGRGTKLAHVVAREALVGETPSGLELDHRCRVRCCCNPAHLEPVTHAENCRRGIGGETTRRRLARITACKHGHPFDEKNTRIVALAGGLRGRQCRTCDRARSAARRKRASKGRRHG